MIPAGPAPGSEPPWPGLLRWPVAGGFVRSNVYYTYDPEIAAEIRSTRWGILTKRSRSTAASRSAPAAALRAGILATWEATHPHHGRGTGGSPREIITIRGLPRESGLIP
jgi:hypothetical protein